MSVSPARGCSGWDGDPAWEPGEPVPTPDWMSEEDWLARCAASADEEPLEFEDDDCWFPGDADAVIAEAEQVAAEEAAAAAQIASLGQTAAMAAASSPDVGRRGPGQPGSARLLPGVCNGPGGGFATGQALDIAAGGPVLLSHIQKAAGDDDRFAGTSDDELAGIIAGADRCEATSSSYKHAAVAELIRRRPAAGCGPQGDRDMPADWDEFTERELGSVLAESRHAMEELLKTAHELEAKLPGTKALFRAGLISPYKAKIMTDGCDPLDPDEARAAERMVLGRAGRLTPGSLRAAIRHAVMEVNAAKAKKSREAARKHARVQLWLEQSGNAAIEARELPVAAGEAMDQRISWWAGLLKKAGVEGSWDQLRAQAFTDLLLGADSRPGHNGQSPAPAAGGFAARANLTIPAATLLDLADRPGAISVLGPIDPWLARDLAAAAAQNPKSTWCVTVTDQDGHAVGHGCARPEPKSQRTQNQRAQDQQPQSQQTQGQRTGRPPPGGGSAFSFTPEKRAGPNDGYGTWRLRTPGCGPDLIIDLEPIAGPDCDHRHESRGHDPGVKLKHLTQIRYATCTAPGCRRPASQSDYEHNIPYEAGGRTCLCNGAPKCRHDHRLKQHPGWTVEQRPDGTFRWTTPSGRSYTTEPTRYPI
jgi:hypothetical protein